MAHSTTTRLLLIRHAQSIANAERRVQGWADDPLSPHGAEQAQKLAAYLRRHNPGADVLFASPLQRAYQTATAVGMALGMEVLVRPGLKEVFVGELEDSTDDRFNQALKNPDFEAFYGMETTRDFTERTLGALHGLLAAHDGQTLMVVSHLGVICVALAYWLERDVSRAWDHYGHIRNTGISEVVFTAHAGSGHVELVRHADVTHLEG